RKFLPRRRYAAPQTLRQRGGAADDLNNFLGDGRLADPVEGQRERVDHVVGIVGRRIHGSHTGGVLRSYRLQERLIDLAGDIARQQIVQQFLRRLLVNVIHWRGAELHGFTFQFGGFRTLQAHAGSARCLAHALALFFRQLLSLRNFAAPDLLHGKDTFDNDPLRNHRLEFIEYQVNAIDLLMTVTFDDAVGQLFHGVVLDFGQQVEVLADNLHPPGALGGIGLDHRETAPQ